MAKPIAARTLKVMDYLRNNPDAPVSQVAGEFGMALSHVYKLRKRVKEEGKEDKAPAAKPKRLYVPVAAAMIAEKLGIPLKEYVEQMRKVDPTAFEETNDLTPEEEPWNATDVDTVLNERAKDYGKFIEGAEIMQMLKRLVHNYVEQRGTPLAFDQREAIDMIIHKLGRIINGNPDKVDHWTDIAGYAKLVADRLEGNVR